VRDYQRLNAALDRLQSTWVTTSIRSQAKGRHHRFSWINNWKKRRDANGRLDGIEMILPEWFYQAVLDDALVLTIDWAYFDLTGGLERWLYRLVRKHGGKQRHGWRFDLRHLHLKSGSLSTFGCFAFDLREIIRRQPLPGYELFIEVEANGRVLLAFERSQACGKPVDSYVLSQIGRDVPSKKVAPCHQKSKRAVTYRSKTEIRPLNLESNIESNFVEGPTAGDKPVSGGKISASDSAGKEANGHPFRADETSAGDPTELPKLPFDGAASGQRP
jgi:plasmid replication initiation protein